MRHLLAVISVAILIVTVKLPFLSAQTQPRPTSNQNRLVLLNREIDALAHLQQVLPAIRCEYHDRTVSQNCRSFVLNLHDETKKVRGDITKYSSEKNPKPEELFDIYVALEWMLTQIQNNSIADEFNGRLYQMQFADAYNTFIKLTGVWFKGEMREEISHAGCPEH